MFAWMLARQRQVVVEINLNNFAASNRTLVLQEAFLDAGAGRWQPRVPVSNLTIPSQSHHVIEATARHLRTGIQGYLLLRVAGEAPVVQLSFVYDRTITRATVNGASSCTTPGFRWSVQIDPPVRHQLTVSLFLSDASDLGLPWVVLEGGPWR